MRRQAASWLVVPAALAAATVFGCGKGGSGSGGGADGAPSAADIRQTMSELANRPRREAAIRKLGRWKVQAAARPILGHLRDPDPAISLAAAWALGEIGDPNEEILQRLRVALTAEKDPRIAAEVARSLGKLHDAGAVFVLVEGGLTHWAAEVRQAAAEAIVAVGPPAGPLLRKALTHPKEHVRALAAVALGRLKDASAAEALVAVLRDEQSEAVRSAAAAALASIGAPAVEPLMVAFTLRNPPARFKAEAGDVLKRIGRPAAGGVARWLVETIDIAAPADLLVMIDALGRIGDPNSAAALRRATKHYDPKVKAAAEAALKKLKP